MMKTSVLPQSVVRALEVARQTYAPSERGRLSVGILSLSLLAACGGGGDDPTVDPPITAVASITVSPATAELAVNGTTSFTAALRTASGVSASGAVAWISSNQAIATVAGNGNSATVTAVAPGNVTVTASSGNVSGSASISVKGPPALVFQSAPLRAFADSVLTPTPRIAVVDDQGRIVTTGSFTVILALAPAANGAVISGTASAVTVGGIATFPNLRINRPGTNYRLQATATGTATTPIATSNPIEIAVAPTVIDSTTLRLTSTAAEQANGTFIFQASAGAPSVQAGTVIVGAQGGGYLRRVVSMSQSGTTVTAQTQPAAITDVVREGNVRTTTRLDPTNPSALASTPSASAVQWGPTTAIAADDWITITNGRYNFARKVIWDGGPDQLVFDGGYLQFTPDVTLDFDVADWKVNRVNVQATGNLTVGLGLTYGVSGSRTLTVPQLPVATVSKRFLTFVGGWPVYGRVEMTISLVPQLSAQAAATVSASTSATAGLTVGAVYDGASWAFNAGPSAQSGFQNPTFTVTASGGASVRVGARVETRLILYETVGPYVWAEPYLGASLKADLVRNVVTSSCQSAVELGFGVSAKIFSVALLDFNKSGDFLSTPDWPVCKRDIPIFALNSIAATQGDAQAASPSSTLPTALGVRVLNNNGTPAAGVPVQWVISSGGGSVSSGSTATSSSGVALTTWTLGALVGQQRVEARLPGATGSPVIFTATARNVGSIGALIVDDATSLPLSNVSVDFICGGVSQGNVRTGTDGRFLSAPLPVGSCQLTAVLIGYDPLTIVSANVTAGISNNLGVLRLKKPQIGDIGGIVRNVSTNAAIVGASVEIRAGANNTTGAATASTVTNSSGAYQFNSLAAGTYTVSISAPGFVSAAFGGVSVDAGTQQGRDFTLTPSAGPSGLGTGFGAEQFALILPGQFQMGQAGIETPVHTVTITRPFLLQRTEVTQGQWRAVMGSNPSFTSCGDSCPVENVSWNDIQSFLTRINTVVDPGKNYRLPTEAEWEYAARAGTTGDYGIAGAVCSFAWIDDGGCSQRKTWRVAQKPANAWGLHDMHGNVWEWVHDWYGVYASTAQSDPTGPAAGLYRVLRGGSWYNSAIFARSAYRQLDSPSLRYNYIGFRLARTP